MKNKHVIIIKYCGLISLLLISLFMVSCTLDNKEPQVHEKQYPLSVDDPEAYINFDTSQYIPLLGTVECVNPDEEADEVNAEYNTGVGYSVIDKSISRIPLLEYHSKSSSSDEFYSPPYKGDYDLNHDNSKMIFDSDDRYKIGDTTAWPYRAIVKLYMTFPNGKKYIGSGSLIGPKSVLTAGHCVHSKDDGGWATEIQVIPAMDGSYQPYGSAWSVHMNSVEGWTKDENSNYDFALITLDRNIGNRCGWFGYSTYSDSDLDELSLYVCGYPGDKSSGKSQYREDDEVRKKTSKKVYYRADTAGGQSGGPVVSKGKYKNTVIAPHTGWNTYFLKKYNRGTRINNDRYDQIKKWIKSNESRSVVY